MRATLPRRAIRVFASSSDSVLLGVGQEILSQCVDLLQQSLAGKGPLSEAVIVQSRAAIPVEVMQARDNALSFLTAMGLVERPCYPPCLRGTPLRWVQGSGDVARYLAPSMT